MTHQKKKHSLLEALISTAIGFVIAFVATSIIVPLIFGFHPSFQDNFIMTCMFTVVSVIRGYYVRRLFNWMHEKEIL
jgi:ABC-type antimicrobial peptide transport system permease subunit